MVKLLVNGLQLSLIIILVSPIAFIWDLDRVERFCSQLKPGMTYQHYVELLSAHNVNQTSLVGIDVEGGQWHAIVSTYLPNDEYCYINGQTLLITRAEMVTK